MQMALAPSSSIMANSTSISAAAAAPRRKSTKNAQFANDGSWDSVKQMLEKFAGKAFRRVDALGIGWEFDDVMGQLRLGYVQALQKWNPQAGVLFSTYCFRVCVNNFNDAIKKQERERAELGMISYDDRAPDMEDGDHDPLESMREGTDTQMSTEDAMVGREEFRERMQGMSQGARRLVTALLTAERTLDGKPAPRLRELAAECGLEGDELRQVKQELLKKFGVRWN